jgi:hypothetical protein
MCSLSAWNATPQNSHSLRPQTHQHQSRDVAQWYSFRLAHVRPWVSSSTTEQIRLYLKCSFLIQSNLALLMSKYSVSLSCMILFTEHVNLILSVYFFPTL